MDISKEYILMCEEAKEIQDLWNNPEVGDFTYNPPYSRWDSWVGCVGDKDCYLVKNTENGSSIWLPRQDQLQEMIVTLGMSSATFLQTMANKVWDSMQSCDYYLQFKSMEQLWLGFIMFEKYNKKWNGKDWR